MSVPKSRLGELARPPGGSERSERGGCFILGTRVPGHEVVRMAPARLRLDPAEPRIDVRMRGAPVDTDLVVEEEIAAQRDVGDGQALADHEGASFQVRVE